MIAAADRGLLSFAGWVGIVLVTVDGMRSWTDLQRLSRWVTTFVGVVAAMGVVQYLTGFDLAALYRIPGLSANSEFGTVYVRSVVRRVMATAGHPIEFGVVVAGVFPLALHRVIYDRRSIRDVFVV